MKSIQNYNDIPALRHISGFISPYLKELESDRLPMTDRQRQTLISYASSLTDELDREGMMRTIESDQLTVADADEMIQTLMGEMGWK